MQNQDLPFILCDICIKVLHLSINMSLISVIHDTLDRLNAASTKLNQCYNSIAYQKNHFTLFASCQNTMFPFLKGQATS